MNKKIIYITYQTFPAYTANSIQTITHLSHFSKKNFDVTLIFPLRNKESDSRIKTLQEFYDFSENFKTIGTIHPLPFKKINFFEKFMYILSHFLWSYFTVGKHQKNNEESYFFTRSEWIFYFLSKKNLKVIYECHQLSKIKKTLIKRCIKNKNSKIVFLNPDMLKDLSIDQDKNIIILPSAYDENIFHNSDNKPENTRIIYAGSLFRFGQSRGIGLFAEHLNKIIDLDIELVVATTDNKSYKFIEQIQKKNKNIKFEIYSNLSRREVSKLYNNCSIGLLVNNDSIHATKFTSPLKFFEYVATGLKVIATDNKAHKLLPYQESIHFFDLNSPESIEKAIRISLKSSFPNYHNLNDYSMDNRITKLSKLFQ